MTLPTTPPGKGKAAETVTEPSVRKVVQQWLLYIMMPAAVVAWTASKKWTVVVGAGLAIPVLAIVQGTVSILTFRVSFGDAPVPIVPSHGVVVVEPEAHADDAQNASSPQRGAASFTAWRDPRFLLGTSSAALSSESMHRAVLGRGDWLHHAVQERPLNILVVGDSLGIGVGQAKVPTPIMPEVIAKTLSKKMGGRVVYWTCHGGTGASSAWLVRELEQGVGYQDPEHEGGDDDYYDELESLTNEKDDIKSTGSDTVSLSDESSTGSIRSGVVQGDETVEKEKRDPLSKQAWQRRLRHHRRCFQPEFMGPYDIAVVLTGPNDMKAAVFPFLLTGEDGEFRKQAQGRGGDYAAELGRVLETLRSRMAVSLRSVRETVQAATHSVRDRVEETVELVAPNSQWASARKRRSGKSLDEETTLAHDDKDDRDAHEEDDQPSDHHHKGHLPLIVLPGLPVLSNPITQHLPLKWLLVPMFGILEWQKQQVARMSAGEILFVPPPTTEDVIEYLHKEGSVYRDTCQEQVLVNLRDARRSTVRRVSNQMEEYYNRKGRSAFSNNPFKRIRTLLGVPPSIHLQAFAADGIHANDLGYDYWGRHIANAIYDEWQRRESHVSASPC
jgi:hypothetical protein